MPTRFEIERAVQSSRLSPPSRHIMHVLCTRMDASANLILPRYQPSLTVLARGTGYDRRTITRHLKRLEAAGWIIRVRPTLADARTKHMRTAYTPLIPEGYPQARAAAGARGTPSPELGAQRPKARGSLPRRFSNESSLSGEGPTPTPPNARDLCPRCSRTGHTADQCKE